MLKMVKRMIQMAGDYKGRLKWAIVISFIEGIFTIMPEMLVMYTVYKIVTQQILSKDVWVIGGMLALGVLLRALTRRIVDGLQSGTGYLMFANERMHIGNHLKRLPMGYFTEGAIGNVTSVVTSDIVFAEQFGMHTMSKVVNAYISMILGSLMLLMLDWRIALIAMVTFALGARSLSKMDLVAKEHGSKRQEGYSRLTGKILEFIKGMPVIKSFNLTGESFSGLNKEFKSFRDDAINFEVAFSKRFVRFHHWFALGVGMVIFMLAWFGRQGQMDHAMVLMMIIYIFQFFRPFQVLGSIAALVRIMEAGLNRYEEVMAVPILDEGAKNVELTHFDIEFKNVSFSYENDKVLKNISFKVPERSMTALVGKSGCGKTTITNLIARFWDVQEGEVVVGSVNVKDMSCESLLKNISMVFQNVYLFQDTILNNILFGRADASMEDVIEACKKARCYDFIMALEKGFDTLVEEGGVSLSGGEKQRISIARAILKDAPIVLLDEATANVDPDNEKYIQEAIDALVKNKTLVVIAHKLSTIQSADQIIVLDKGEIVQKGLHDKLSQSDGLYRSFWERRMKAKSWKIKGESI